MTLDELLKVVADDTLISIYDYRGKRVYYDTKLNWKSYSIEVQYRRTWLDDEQVDYIVPDDLDELVIHLY